MIDLYPYQTEGRDALAANRRFILGDEMGLGKTVQVIAALSSGTLPAVVICPASVRFVWADEVSKWRPGLSVDVITSGKQKPAGADVTVVSYELFGKVKLPAPRLIVCDEAHYLQSRKAQRTKRVLAAASGPACDGVPPCVWLLTGTPMWSRPRSLFPLLKICEVWPGDYYTYTAEHCNAAYRFKPGQGRVWDDTGASKIPELRERLAPVMLRRLKDEVLADLPAKTRQVVKVAAGLSEAETDLDSFSPAAVADGIIPPGPIATAIRETALLKVPHVVAHIRDVLETEDKVVVFAWNVEVIDALAAALHGYGVASIQGSTPADKRAEAVQCFQWVADCRVFIGQTVAAGTGITLTAARVAVFAQPDWTPANILQAEDRIHRIGQEYPALVQFLVTRGSIEEVMLSGILSKMAVARRVLDHERGTR